MSKTQSDLSLYSGLPKVYSTRVDPYLETWIMSIFTLEKINTTYPRKIFLLQFEPFFFEQHVSP